MLKRPQAARLLAVDREADGTRLLLLGRDEAAVGSAEGSALRVADPNVADRHAVVRCARGGYYIVDLKSGAGTYVNGRRIRRTQRLKHGDVLRFGSAPPYRFLDPDAQERRRWRRNLRLAAALAILIAFGLVDHFEKWGVVSIATISKIVALTESSRASKTIEPPVAVAVRGSAQATAPSGRATTAPSPAAQASTIAVAAASASFLTPEPIATIAPTPTAPRLHRAATTAHRATAAPLIVPENPERIPTALPMAETTPSASELNTNWLAVLNLYRTRLNLPTVEEDPALSHGCAAHAKYLVMNYEPTFASGWNIGGLMHTEDESKPGYTPEGIKAARASDVTFQPPWKFTDEQRMTRAIQSWIAGPFHRASLVNPPVRQVGFGEYCGTRVCVAALDWRSDLPPSPLHGRTFATPIEVPPDGASVKPSGFGGEWPSPTAPCPGYPNNAPAITLQIGSNTAAMLGDASLTQTSGAAAGTKVATCAYDFLRYTNPDPGTQAHGRQSLRSFGEVVMMVRDPLVGGETYRVDMNVNGQPYSWSFTALK